MVAVIDGTVLSFNPFSGYGFNFGKNLKRDVFVWKDELAGRVVVKGDKVRFGLQRGSKGLRACNVEIVTATPAVVPPLYGKISYFNSLKGYGFISSCAASDEYGRDVFFRRRHFAAAAVGATVIFSSKMGVRGPFATNIAPLSGGRSFTSQRWPCSQGSTHSKVKASKKQWVPRLSCLAPVEQTFCTEEESTTASDVESAPPPPSHAPSSVSSQDPIFDPWALAADQPKKEKVVTAPQQTEDSWANFSPGKVDLSTMMTDCRPQRCLETKTRAVLLFNDSRVMLYSSPMKVRARNLAAAKGRVVVTLAMLPLCEDRSGASADVAMTAALKDLGLPAENLKFELVATLEEKGKAVEIHCAEVCPRTDPDGRFEFVPLCKILDMIKDDERASTIPVLGKECVLCPKTRSILRMPEIADWL